MKFIIYNGNKNILDSSDCGIIAICNLLNLEYNMIHKIFRDKFNRYEGNGIDIDNVLIVIKEKAKELNLDIKKIDFNSNVEEFCDKYFQGNFLVCANEHLETIKNGNIYTDLSNDWLEENFTKYPLEEIYQIL